MKEEMIEIHWTSASLDEARKVCRHLVQNRLVACSQIIPWIESIYLWNNQLETAQESKIVLKTLKRYYSEVQEVILQNCKYQVPEITWLSIEGGSEEYLKWIEESAKPVEVKHL